MPVRFPQVSGANLARKQLNLPQDFNGQANILLIAFHQWQQGEVDTWVPTAQELEATYPGVRYYELPTIRSMNRLVRAFINGGMRAGIPDRLARERTITLYLDKDAFRQALELSDEDHIHVLLLDGQGVVRWRARGVLSADKARALEDRLGQLAGEAEQ
jgi:hypothetical protein